MERKADRCKPGVATSNRFGVPISFQEALFGCVLVYFAAIPLSRLRRFVLSFRPEMTKNGDVIVAAIIKRWREGDFVRMWVYPKGDLFIVSDDYFTLGAAERGRPDFCPLWVLGEVKNDGKAEQVQGPIGQVGLREMLGLAKSQ
jgi:hypothetical protein